MPTSRRARQRSRAKPNAHDRALLTPLDGREFARFMAGIGPLPPRPSVVVGVSGGADSTALAVLARDWARGLGGEIHAVLIDHGLRPAAALEAAATRARLAALGIPMVVLHLHGLAGGSAVERRGRKLRHALLEAACTELGAVVLMLGHQVADQAETLLLRACSGSGAIGLAAMAARRDTARVVLLRPLLGVPPDRLRATLGQRSVGWIEDLSNDAPAFRRARLRSRSKDRAGTGCATLALAAAAAAHAKKRAALETERNRALAQRVALYPQGFARLAPGPLPPAALASLLRTLSGSAFAPSEARIAAFAQHPHPATLGGVRFLTAGRSRPGLLAVREIAAMEPPVPAIPGVLWDQRFRLRGTAEPPDDATLGPLGPAAAGRLRPRSALPAVVLATLPALRIGEKLAAVPHLGYPDEASCRRVPVLFSPAEPAGGAPFAVAQRYRDVESGSRAYVS